MSHGGNAGGLKRSHITIIITIIMVTIIMVTIKCRWAGMQASGSLRALQTFNFCLLLDNMGSKNFFGGTNFSIELKCRWTGMQASGSPRVPSHLTQGGTILCKAVGIGANCHSKGIWNKIHGHQTFITFNTKYGAWMKKKYSRGGIWQNCSFKACFFWKMKSFMICNKTHDEFFMPVT